MGRDVQYVGDLNPENQFQSTRPVWGVTYQNKKLTAARFISIHTPRVGRDDYFGYNDDLLCISIHTPRVGRDLWYNI